MIDFVRPTQLCVFEILAPRLAPVFQSLECADPELQHLALELVDYLLPVLSQPNGRDLVAAQCLRFVLLMAAMLAVLVFPQVAYP